jgi:hypothetical protein
MTASVESKLAEVMSLEKDIRKELGLLQLRLKHQTRSSGDNRTAKFSVWRSATTLGVKEQVTLFLVCFLLLFAASPVFRGLLFAAYRHYGLGISLDKALEN